MAASIFLRSARSRQFHQASLSAYRSWAGNAKPSISSFKPNKWLNAARPFSSRAMGSDVIGVDLGTTNSCV
nr:heat shock 70 kDa protein, mitochondrial [Tanacetum cinerariifolium]